MPHSTKYGMVKLELAPAVPDAEPCFVLRGQDELAADTVRYYARKYILATGDTEGHRRIMSEAALLETWPTKKLPD